MTLLAVENLVKRFGGLVATDSCSLTVGPGEIHALIGPNGAGKTTLVAQVAGSLAPTSGRILLGGDDITHLPIHHRVKRGLIRSYQIPALFTQWTVAANVQAAALAAQDRPLRLFHSVQGDAALQAKVAETVARVGLGARSETPVGRLSHGEKRLLEIALALAGQPRLLLLDEPLAGVGPAEAEALIALIAALRADAGILLVEHDMTAVFALADRITVLVGGRVVASGPPEAIRSDPAVRAAYLGDEE